MDVHLSGQLGGQTGSMQIAGQQGSSPEVVMSWLAAGMSDKQLGGLYGVRPQSAARFRAAGWNPTVSRFIDYLAPFGARLAVLLDDESVVVLRSEVDASRAAGK